MEPNEMIEHSINNIKLLFDKYKDNEYMCQRIYNHMSNILPNTLETEYENYNERQIRTNTLHADQESFIKVFLSKHQYYYLFSTNCFYEYDKNSVYKIVKEDDIQHKLLSTITEDGKLMDWKHKTKINIIKQIKNRNLLKSVPDTMTIQHVLNVLCPAFFPTKTSAKYFLTIIGDNILKKVSDIKILNKQISMFNDLDSISYMIGCNSITQNFTSKYHENHNYTMYRLLLINEEFSSDIWKSMIKKLGLNLLCVASHYSNRHENSEKYIDNCSDNILKSHVLYFKTNSQKQIIDQFTNYSLQKIEDNTFTISWKNLHYIWKLYLSTMKIPNMIYSNSLKQSLREKIEYNESTDSFCNITSKFLPSMSEFLNFWKDNIHTQSQINVEFVEELEINELYELFKKMYPNTTINENDVYKLIRHFFPEIEIIDNKYILYITSSPSCWNKNEDILISLQLYKTKVQSLTDIISFEEVYLNYINYCVEKHFLVANKKYFEKYVSYKLKEYIVFDNFIGSNWIN